MNPFELYSKQATKHVAESAQKTSKVQIAFAEGDGETEKEGTEDKASTQSDAAAYSNLIALWHFVKDNDIHMRTEKLEEAKVIMNNFVDRALEDGDYYADAIVALNEILAQEKFPPGSKGAIHAQRRGLIIVLCTLITRMIKKKDQARKEANK